MKIKPRVKKTLAYCLLALAGAAQADDIPTPRVALRAPVVEALLMIRR